MNYTQRIKKQNVSKQRDGRFFPMRYRNQRFYPRDETPNHRVLSCYRCDGFGTVHNTNPAEVIIDTETNEYYYHYEWYTECPVCNGHVAIPRKHIITNGKNVLCYNFAVYIMCCVNSN